MNGIVPKALAYAAKAYAESPKKLGEVVLALVGGDDARLDEGQRVVVAICRGEMADRAACRARAAERKRRWRAKSGKGRAAR